jgi:hypothetical protein
MNLVNLGHPNLLRASARQESCASIPSSPEVSAACPDRSPISGPAMRYPDRLTALAQGKPEIETP